MKKEQFEKITEWQNKTFGKASVLAKIEHLKEEIEELEKEFLENDNKIAKEDEFADCFILLFGAASAFGMSYKDISDCIDSKMKVNYKRKWGKPNEKGVINHVCNHPLKATV